MPLWGGGSYLGVFGGAHTDNIRVSPAEAEEFLRKLLLAKTLRDAERTYAHLYYSTKLEG
jgi:hypothetical protein